MSAVCVCVCGFGGDKTEAGLKCVVWAGGCVIQRPETALMVPSSKCSAVISLMEQHDVSAFKFLAPDTGRKSAAVCLEISIVKSSVPLCSISPSSYWGLIRNSRITVTFRHFNGFTVSVMTLIVFVATFFCKNKSKRNTEMWP